MANVRVAINGFGRIGRLAFRQMFGAEGYEVVAINDLTSPKMLAHLLKYDSSQGKYALADKVTYKDAIFEEDGKTVKVPGSITVDGKEITIYACPAAKDLPWGELKVASRRSSSCPRGCPVRSSCRRWRSAFPPCWCARSRCSPSRCTVTTAACCG